MKITNLEEMQELSVMARIEYERGVLEGPLFKDILAKMEVAALDGRGGFTKGIMNDEDIRDYHIIKKAFQDAGYECKVEIEYGRSLFNLPYCHRQFIVSWDKK